MNDVIFEPNQMYWQGEPVGDMTKDELIQALYELGNLYQKSLDDGKKQLRK